MRLLCVNIMWFNQLLGDTCPVQRCRCLLANNVEEEVQMNPGAHGGHVYLTPLLCQPISCQASANGWPGYDLQGHGGLQFDGQLIYTQQRHSSVERQCPCWSQSIATESSQSISIQLWLMENWSWQATINMFIFVFVLDPVCGLLKAALHKKACLFL